MSVKEGARRSGFNSGATPGAAPGRNPSSHTESNLILKPQVGGSSPPGGIASDAFLAEDSPANTTQIASEHRTDSGVTKHQGASHEVLMLPRMLPRRPDCGAGLGHTSPLAASSWRSSPTARLGDAASRRVRAGYLPQALLRLPCPPTRPDLVEPCLLSTQPLTHTGSDGAPARTGTHRRLDGRST